MEEDVRTKIQQIGNGNDHWMLSSDDAYVIEQYRAVCENEGKTVLEKCGVFDSRKKVESILSRLRERPVLWGTRPRSSFFDEVRSLTAWKKQNVATEQQKSHGAT